MQRKPKRRWEATSQTTVTDLERILTRIGATSFHVEKELSADGKGWARITFDRKGKRYVRECNGYYYSLDNLRAIGLQIDYLYRAFNVLNEVITAKEFEIEFDSIFGGLIADVSSPVMQLGDGSKGWWHVLGVERSASPDAIRNAYRALATVHHPDAGGDSTQFNELTRAFREGLEERNRTTS